MENKTYISIDLKSFFASVECVARGLDPLRTNLVVADSSRTEKTICLAVTPSLKSYGIAGRARMFEVVQRVRDVNRERVAKAPGRRFSGSSCDDGELKADPGLAVDYIVAKPRMALYKNTSVEIYRLYLNIGYRLCHNVAGSFLFNIRAAHVDKVGVKHLFHAAVYVVGKAPDIETLYVSCRLNDRYRHHIADRQHKHSVKRFGAVKDIHKAPGKLAFKPRTGKQPKIVDQSRDCGRKKRNSLHSEI